MSARAPRQNNVCSPYILPQAVKTGRTRKSWPPLSCSCLYSFFFVRAAYHCLLVTCVTINYAQLLYAHVAGSIAGLNVLLHSQVTDMISIHWLESNFLKLISSTVSFLYSFSLLYLIFESVFFVFPIENLAIFFVARIKIFDKIANEPTPDGVAV